MKVLVCGGRHFNDEKIVYSALDRLQPSKIIEGGATGADWLARLWAIDHGVDYETIFAEWKKYGHSAGPIRNANMLEQGKPDLVVAFPGGRGTADMVRRAQAAGVQTEIVA